MTDAQAALAQVREALANEALFDPGASTADTYSACKAFGTACTPENMRAILAHVEAQEAENERLTAERDDLRAEVSAQAAEIKRLRKLAMSTHLFEEAPCFLCGYNGPGYYQPEQHPCAALYHEAMEEQR